MSSPESQRPFAMPSTIVLWLGGLMVAALIGSATLFMWQRYLDAAENAQREVGNLAFVISQETARSLEAVDLVLRGVADRLAAAGVDSPDSYMEKMHRLDVHEMLRNRIEGLPQIDAVTMIRADGRLINFSRYWPIPDVNLADRGYFKAARDDPSLTRIISEPVRNRGDGRWTIYLARRVTGQDGTFIGLILGAMTLDYFDRLYREIALGEESSIGLIRADGLLLARHPAVGAPVGSSLAGSPLLKALAGKPRADLVARSAVDGITRVIAARSLQNFPLAVVVTRAEGAVLADWREQLWQVAATTLAVCGILTVAVVLLWRQMHRRERSERALAASETRFRALTARKRGILDALPAQIALLDADGTVVTVNRAWQQHQPAGGFIAQACGIGANYLAVCEQEARACGHGGAEVLSGLRGVLDGRLAACDARYQVSGGACWYRFMAAPLANGGGAVVMHVDVTAATIAEEALIAAKAEAEEANRVKADFLATMSHEIRTPLNGVIGLSGLLLDGGLEGEERSHALALRRAAEHLLEIINDILDFSKLEAGSVELEESAFSPRDVLASVVEVLKPAAAEKSIALEVRVAPELPELLLGDPSRLRQVILNIAGNAVKFTQAGKVSVEAVPRIDAAGRPRLAIAVQDTGIGIPPQALTKLFAKFSQVDASITRRFGGTGLGLAISKRLSVMMGGDIEVASEVGRGSRFTIAIPLRAAQGVADNPGDLHDRPTLPDLGRTCRVLLAEDNRTNQIVAVRMLEREGCRVDAVGNGIEAVQALRERDYDIVLMDMMMPEMDGLQATRAIRALSHRSAKLPIIALTANAFAKDRDTCLAAGMNGFVSKPVKRDRLIQAMAAALRGETAAGVPDPRATEPSGVDVPSLDTAELNALFASYGADAAEFVGVFVAETEDRLARMANLVSRNDWRSLLREAHSLKSSAATFGCRRLSALARALEQDAARPVAGGAQALVPRLAAEFDAVRHHLVQRQAA